VLFIINEKKKKRLRKTAEPLRAIIDRTIVENGNDTTNIISHGLASAIDDTIYHHHKDEIIKMFSFCRKMPTALEYFSYIFHFQALMAGPVIFYRDYTDFIHRQQHVPSTKTVSACYSFALCMKILFLLKVKLNF